MLAKISSLSSRWVYGIGVAIFLIYSVWILGPYLQSVFVRDASVTSWARVTTAPIAGKIVTEIPSVNSAIGADGHLATIENDQPFTAEERVEQVKDKIELTQTRVKDIEGFIENLKRLEAQLTARRDQYAETFRKNLENRLSGLEKELSISRDRVAIMERMLVRQQAQSGSDTAALTARDELQLRLSDMKLNQADLEARLKFARVRHGAAKNGVFIEDNGSPPAWVLQNETNLKIQQYNAENQLHEAKVGLQEARAAQEHARANLKRLSKAVVTVPAGAVMLSIEVPPGAIVAAGDVLAKWVDCTIVLVDVPVSDAELPLIRKGMKATVILEGEPDVREAEVLLTRGSTATLDQHNLAALAKGRHEGVAQVIVQLDSTEFSEGACPVGRAAYVEFPDVGLIDVIRARLRL